MKANLKTVCALAVFSAAGSGVFAGGPIDLSDFSGSEQVITFTPGFSQQCAPFLYEGVTFSENGGGTGGACFNATLDWGGFFANIPGSSQGIGFHDQWGDSLIIMELPAGMTKFGCLLSTGPATDFTLTLFDSGNSVIGSVTGSMPAGSQAVFLGYETDVAIARAEITEPNGENGNITLMDDVRFEGGAVDCLAMTVTALVAGQSADWDVSGATPGAEVAVVYGFNPGSTTLNGFAGYCADFGIDGVTANRVICRKTADGGGNVSCKVTIPKNAGGLRILSQASERDTCPDPCMSNLDDQTVQ